MADEKQTLGSRVTETRRSAWLKAPGILGGIALAAGLGLVLLETSLGDALRNKSYDLPFQFRPIIEPQEAVLVYQDDSSYEQLHQLYTEPFDRRYFTLLLNRLTAEHAKAAVFDIVFSDSRGNETDQKFAEAMRNFGNVILACDWVIKYYGGNTKAGKVYTKPAQLFNESASDVGTSTLFPDEGAWLRTYVPTIPGGGDATNSEAWAAAILVKPSLNESNYLKTHPFSINFYAPDLTLPSVSLYKAIAPHDPDVRPGYFSNKVVFVGAKLQTHLASERKDEYSTPFSYLPVNKWMAGVAIHATAFLNLIRGDYLREFPYWVNRGLIVAFGILFGGGLVLCRPLSAVTIGLLSTLPIAFADYFVFDRYYYWFPWLIVVVVQIPAGIVWSVTYNSIRLHVDKKLAEQTLGLYLSKKLVKKFASDPARLMRPGATKQLLTILFTDIAGFTTISEGMDPDELARLMNAYFQTAVANCIFPTDGVVVKYIGDAIFAFWNAPDPQPDHAFRGCDAALRFCALPSQRVNGSELVTRLGLHTGEANVGNFGSNERFDYTAIGENINLSSRMEGLNKYLGTRVLITGDTHKEVGSRLVTRYLGLFRLKGFEKAVAVYELMAFPEKEAESRELRERFEVAREKFAKRDFAGADEAFRKVKEIAPEDGPTEFYLEQMEELRTAELPPEWKGEITLKDK